MEKVMLMISAMFFALQAFAGGVSDGGGNAVVCYDGNGQITSAEVFDLYEARNLYGFGIRNQDSKDSLEVAKFAASSIDHGGAGTDPSIVVNGQMSLRREDMNSNFVRSYVSYIHQYMKVLSPGVGLKPIDDSNNIIIPKDCKLVQLAVYQDRNDSIFIDGDIWPTLGNTNKAALLVHEALYKKLRMGGEKTSERARTAVGASLAGYTLQPIAADVPQNAMLCWSTDKEDEFRFAVYRKSYGSGDRAVYQFFRMDGKVPLTKTSVEGEIETSPLAPQMNGGASWEAAVQDSVLDYGYKTHWTFQKNTARDFYMTVGGARGQHPVKCSQPADYPVPWPWDDSQGKTSWQSAYLINASASSCYDITDPNGQLGHSISPMYIGFKDLSIEWNDPDSDLYVVGIEATIHIPGVISYQAVMAGNELLSLNRTHGQWSGVVPRSQGGKPSVFTTSCPPRFGDISIRDPHQAFTVPGTLAIIGFSRDSNGNEKPVRIENYFKAINAP